MKLFAYNTPHKHMYLINNSYYHNSLINSKHFKFVIKYIFAVYLSVCSFI